MIQKQEWERRPRKESFAIKDGPKNKQQQQKRRAEDEVGSTLSQQLEAQQEEGFESSIISTPSATPTRLGENLQNLYQMMKDSSGEEEKDETHRWW